MGAETSSRSLPMGTTKREACKQSRSISRPLFVAVFPVLGISQDRMTLVLGVHAYLMRSACVQRGLKQGRFRCSVDNLEVSARQLALWINCTRRSPQSVTYLESRC